MLILMLDTDADVDARFCLSLLAFHTCMHCKFCDVPAIIMRLMMEIGGERRWKMFISYSIVQCMQNRSRKLYATFRIINCFRKIISLFCF